MERMSDGYGLATNLKGWWCERQAAGWWRRFNVPVIAKGTSSPWISFPPKARFLFWSTGLGGWSNRVVVRIRRWSLCRLVVVLDGKALVEALQGLWLASTPLGIIPFLGRVFMVFSMSLPISK